MLLRCWAWPAVARSYSTGCIRYASRLSRSQELIEEARRQTQTLVKGGVREREKLLVLPSPTVLLQAARTIEHDHKEDNNRLKHYDRFNYDSKPCAILERHLSEIEAEIERAAAEKPRRGRPRKTYISDSTSPESRIGLKEKGGRGGEDEGIFSRDSSNGPSSSLYNVYKITSSLAEDEARAAMRRLMTLEIANNARPFRPKSLRGEDDDLSLQERLLRRRREEKSMNAYHANYAQSSGEADASPRGDFGSIAVEYYSSSTNSAVPRMPNEKAMPTGQETMMDAFSHPTRQESRNFIQAGLSSRTYSLRELAQMRQAQREWQILNDQQRAEDAATSYNSLTAKGTPGAHPRPRRSLEELLGIESAVGRVAAAFAAMEVHKKIYNNEAEETSTASPRGEDSVTPVIKTATSTS